MTQDGAIRIRRERDIVHIKKCSASLYVIARLRTIEVNDRLPAQMLKITLQAFDQCLFIIDLLQAQAAHVRNQIVSVN